MTKTVLMIEDNEDMRELIGLALAKSGYQLITAMDGIEAVETCLREQPDLVLMDLKMPRMNGFEATRELREKGYKRPIIVLTASDSEEDRKMAMSAGCDAYLIKNMEMSGVERVIDRYLTEPGGI